MHPGTYSFSMAGHTPSGQINGESGVIDDFSLDATIPQFWTTFHWGTYTRVDTTLHATVVVTIHQGADYGPFTLELEGELATAPLLPLCPCSLAGVYVQYDGERASTVPDGVLPSNGGDPVPATAPTLPSWSATKTVSGSFPATEFAELRWQWRRGLDRSCRPGTNNDGWACTGPQKHGIRYTGIAMPIRTTGSGTNIEYWRSYIESGYDVTRWRSTADVGCWGESESHCAYPNSDDYWHFPGGSSSWPPPIPEWKLWETYDSGLYHIDFAYHYLQGCTYLSYNCSSYLYTYEGADYDWDTAAPTTSGLSLPTIDALGNTNLPPVVELGVPRTGRAIRRNALGDVKLDFTYTARDPNGHRWTGDLRLYEPGVTPCADSAGSDCYAYRNTLSGAKQASNKTVRVAGVTLPRENGTYTWRARATDTSGPGGNSGLAGSWVTGTFDYIFNLAPEVPTLVAPVSAVPVGQAPSFVVDSVDPEDDPYVGLIEIRKPEDPGFTRTVETAPAASGTPAMGQLAEVLEPGEFEWRARAFDVLVAGTPESSAFSTWQAFTVVGAPGNEAPGAPSLDAPSEGATFAHDNTVTFTITATDPDGDDYLGEVTATDLNTGEETTMFTEAAPSGQASSGSPGMALDPGSYEWTARAVDSRGNAGPQADTAKTFVVEAPPPNLAPTTALVSPDDGHLFEPNDPQVLTVNAVDPEGDAYTAEVRVDGEVLCTTPMTPSGEDAPCTLVPPVGSGAHTWDARALDAHGNAGEWAPSRGFSVRENRAPVTPSPSEPADSHTFATGEQQLFAVKTVDPDGDLYRAHVVVKQGTTTVAEFDTAESPSGTDSFGRPGEPLDPGDYTWSAKAIDSEGNESEYFSPSRSFTVNRLPDTPTLIDPADGHEFPEGGEQAFSLSATDPDGHPYRGEVTVRNADTNAVVLVFTTQQADSGAASTGSPPVRLPPGGYRWSATASDDHGGTSGVSSTREFSVAGSLDNYAPGAPVLVSPDEGTTHPSGDPDRFVVRATDPNEDPYTATVTVRDTSTSAVVASFETRPAPSGTESTGRPSDFVPVGSYTWSATATDLRGETGPASASRAFTVVPADP